jgi:hypothetical protein
MLLVAGGDQGGQLTGRGPRSKAVVDALWKSTSSSLQSARTEGRDRSLRRAEGARAREVAHTRNLAVLLSNVEYVAPSKSPRVAPIPSKCEVRAAFLARRAIARAAAVRTPRADR